MPVVKSYIKSERAAQFDTDDLTPSQVVSRIISELKGKARDMIEWLFETLKGSFTFIASQRLAPTAEHLAYPTIISCLAGLEQDEVTQSSSYRLRIQLKEPLMELLIIFFKAKDWESRRSSDADFTAIIH